MQARLGRVPGSWISPWRSATLLSVHRHYRPRPRSHKLQAAKQPSTSWKCGGCGKVYAKREYRCPKCDSYDIIETQSTSLTAAGGGAGIKAFAGLTEPSSRSGSWVVASDPPKSMAALKGARSDRNHKKIALEGPVGEELCRVLGGGITRDSLILLGGDPGVGKSTLLLQVAGMLATSKQADERNHKRANKGASKDVTDGAEGNTVLYITAEESEDQVYDRARRMCLQGADDCLYINADSDLERALEHITEVSPSAIIVDSIQTVFLRDLPSSPGSVVQVRECSNALLRVAKDKHIIVVLVAQVTKGGDIAGPKVLEHLVDVVLYLEQHTSHKALRVMKNRYGPNDDIGFFRMTREGLKTVEDPSHLFLSSGLNRTGKGTAVAIVCAGLRPLALEVQALTHQRSPQSEGKLCRNINGVKDGRVMQLLAVLDRHVGTHSTQMNVYVNIVGGYRVPDKETAVDLAVAAALVSDCKGVPVPVDMVFIGEVGLAGELRPVGEMAVRLSEASKMGFKRAIIPAASSEELGRQKFGALKVISCGTLKEAISSSLGAAAAAPPPRRSKPSRTAAGAANGAAFRDADLDLGLDLDSEPGADEVFASVGNGRGGSGSYDEVDGEEVEEPELYGGIGYRR